MRKNKKFRVFITKEAQADIDNLFNFIVTEYKTEQTANNYIDGLVIAIQELGYNGDIYRIQKSPFFEKFGTQIRRVNYKKMTIIYSIFVQTLYVRRILPASLILE